MSAPNTAPYVPPPMPPLRRPRSIFGPLVLIIVGVVFMLRNMGVISTHGLGWWFAHYWPVLLILWGVAKVIEYIWATRRGYAPPTVGPGSIVFLIFFVMFGIAATQLSRVNWSGMRDEWGVDPDVNISDPFGILGTRYEFSENFVQEAKPDTQIKIMVNRGDVNITASQDGQIHGFVHKYVRGDSQDEANKLNEATHPKFLQQGNIWVLDLTAGNYERGHFNLDLQLPRNAGVSVMSHNGNLSATQQTGKLELSTDHGDLTVDGLKGNAYLNIHSGDLSVKEVTGDVQVDGSVHDSNVSGVGGNLVFNAGYTGDIELARVARSLHFKSVRTDMQFTRLDGTVSMDRNDIRLNGVTGPVVLQTSYKDIQAEDVSGELRLQNKNGGIEVHPKQIQAPIEISNSHGDITLTVPASAGFQLDAESDNGDISTDLNINVDNQRRNAVARGTVGKGGPSVRLRTQNGRIDVSKQ